MPGRSIGHGGRTKRAFRAYAELMDAAERLRKSMGRQLEAFGLTMVQFRVLEMIYRKGPRYQEAISRRLGCTKQNISLVVEELEREGWVKRIPPRLPATAEGKADAPIQTESLSGRNGAQAKARPAIAAGRGAQAGCTNKKKPHWRVTEIRLTREGKRSISSVFFQHAKVVKAEMRALDGREQESLANLCKKVRIGDFGKFLQEIVMVDPEEMEDWKSGMYRLEEDEG
jgi:DNA-binding Lrp family transcriptional regulator